jgi:hypothetical protein
LIRSYRKLLNFIGIAIVIVGISVSTAPASDVYGKGVTLDKVTLISQILDNPDKYVGKEIRVNGLIVDVCSRRGCWIELASDRAFEKLRIKVADGVIVFPMSARGLNASVQGTVEGIKMTEEEALWFRRHQAEERGTTFDPSTVKGPETIYQIRASGAEVSSK